MVDKELLFIERNPTTMNESTFLEIPKKTIPGSVWAPYVRFFSVMSLRQGSGAGDHAQSRNRQFELQE